MINAATELKTHVEDYGTQILCAVIFFASRGEFCLSAGYSPAEETKFFNEIDWEYQNYRESLFGTIWYTDGSWSERATEDDAEYWEHRQRPKVPIELLKTENVDGRECRPFV